MRSTKGFAGFGRPQAASNIACVLTLASCLGCATTPYHYGGDFHTQNDAPLQPGEPQIERGRPLPAVDTVGWIVGVPSKIVMLDHRVNNHQVSAETEQAIGEYLASNDLDRVKVRINQYDPGGEWRRLVQNKSVGWPARYTVGTLSLVGYTLLPGRIFGVDHYNPYTNTINLYSDVPAIALYQGGHAKDYAQTQYKGAYAVASLVPGVNLVHHTQAANDAVSYLAQNGTPDEIQQSYRSVYPMYAVRTSDPLAAVTGAPLVLPAIVTGHLLGQVQAANYRQPEVQERPAEVQQAGFSRVTSLPAESPSHGHH